jgi:hypothetical protein
MLLFIVVVMMLKYWSLLVEKRMEGMDRKSVVHTSHRYTGSESPSLLCFDEY